MWIVITSYSIHYTKLYEENCRPGDPRALEILLPAFVLLGRLHASGLIQTDLHLGNFLEHEGELFLIDGDGIEPVPKGTGTSRPTLDNLALLVAQLPLAWESSLDVLNAAYTAEQERLLPEPDALLRAIERAREQRLTHFLGKTLRDCSQFAVRGTTSLFSAVARAEKDVLAELLVITSYSIHYTKLYDHDAILSAGQTAHFHGAVSYNFV